MTRRPLAARFDDFDDEDARRQAAYLDAQAATPFWRERKRESYELLGLKPGMSVLDVGCGTGDDVRAMAEIVSPGQAVGVDASPALIDEARRRGGEFVVADAARLPFAEREFDAVRAERVLQHVEDPSAVLAEMARVGRALVAIEPDWGTLEIETDPPDVGPNMAERWRAAIRNPRIGAQLKERFDQAWTHTSVITDPGFAEQQFALSELAVTDDWRFVEARVDYVTVRA